MSQARNNALKQNLFNQKVRASGKTAIAKSTITVLQINLGDRCNQTCVHCHVGATPSGSREMTMETAKRLVHLAAQSPTITTVDLTGGAPELNPCFPFLVTEMRALGKKLIDRCNLTVLLEPGMENIPDLLKRHEVEIIASLPCYTAENVDAQRGEGTFERSIEALKRLNDIGYGVDDALPLTLVYNPGGGFLPGARAALERDYKARLKEGFGVRFTALQTMTNMPIGRFEGGLKAAGAFDTYLQMLEGSFNPDTVDGLMCRNLVSVCYDGTLYDCDFNLAKGLPMKQESDAPLTIFDIDHLSPFEGRPVETDVHCLGCTGGTGSGCFGEIA